jgi:hypothetical protein
MIEKHNTQVNMKKDICGCLIFLVNDVLISSWHVVLRKGDEVFLFMNFKISTKQPKHPN